MRKLLCKNTGHKNTGDYWGACCGMTSHYGDHLVSIGTGRVAVASVTVGRCILCSGTSPASKGAFVWVGFGRGSFCPRGFLSKGFFGRGGFWQRGVLSEGAFGEGGLGGGGGWKVFLERGLLERVFLERGVCPRTLKYMLWVNIACSIC